MNLNKLKANYQELLGICALGLAVYFGYLGTKGANEFLALFSELQTLENKKYSTQWQSFESKGEIERFVAQNYRTCLEQMTSQSTCRANTVFIANTKYGSNFGVKVLDSIDRQEWINVKLSALDEDRMAFLSNRIKEKGI